MMRDASRRLTSFSLGVSLVGGIKISGSLCEARGVLIS
jgi:hypothetical protein